jgi:hypothetical protein
MLTARDLETRELRRIRAEDLFWYGNIMATLYTMAEQEYRTWEAWAVVMRAW